MEGIYGIPVTAVSGFSIEGKQLMGFLLQLQVVSAFNGIPVKVVCKWFHHRRKAFNESPAMIVSDTSVTLWN